MQGGKGVREERVSGTLPRTRSQPLNRDVGAGLAPAHPGAVWPPDRAPTRGAPTRLIQQKFPPAGRFVRISLASGRHHAPYLPEYWRVGKTAHRMPGFGEAAGYPGRLGNSAPSPQRLVPSTQSPAPRRSGPRRSPCHLLRNPYANIREVRRLTHLKIQRRKREAQPPQASDPEVSHDILEKEGT